MSTDKRILASLLPIVVNDGCRTTLSRTRTLVTIIASIVLRFPLHTMPDLLQTILLPMRPSKPNPQTSGYSTPLAMQILRALKNLSSITTNFPSQNRLSVLAGWKFRQKETRSLGGRIWTSICAANCPLLSGCGATYVINDEAFARRRSVVFSRYKLHSGFARWMYAVWKVHQQSATSYRLWKRREIYCGSYDQKSGSSGAH